MEIWNDPGGGADVFVSAVGTGGTITGVGEILKDPKPSMRVVAVEPATAAFEWRPEFLPCGTIPENKSEADSDC